MNVITRAETAAPSTEAYETAPCIFNLLNDFQTLCPWLLSELEAAVGDALTVDAADEDAELIRRRDAHVLDAFLVAAGLNQILEDYLHQDVLSLTKVAKHVAEVRPPVGKLAASSATQLGGALHVARTNLPAVRRLAQLQQQLARLVGRLADQVAARVMAEAGDAPAVTLAGRDAYDAEAQRQALEEQLATARALMDVLEQAPEGLRQSVVRLPSCFRSFDQHPADGYLIARRFADRWPDRLTPLLVVGVRTSGSYLAPLYAAFLRALGYERTQAMTVRPGRRWLAHEQAGVRRIAQEGGRALIADDPPTSGGSVAKAARQVEACGIPAASITLLTPLFGASASLPPVLATYDTIVLPSEEWTVHQRLAPAAVRETLMGLLRGRTLATADEDGAECQIVVESVEGVECVPLTLPPDDLTALPHLRGHARARYRVLCRDCETGRLFTHDVYVKGAGLGYFGTHSVDLARALPAFHPETFGMRDGLLYRSWRDEAERVHVDAASLTTGETDAFAERVASYVAQRAELLAMPEELSARLGGRDPLWQRAGDFIGQGFGRAALIFRPALHQLARTLLVESVAHPSVVDGSMSPAQWFVSPSPVDAGAAGMARAVKVDYDERAFSNRDMYSYDPAFDLAAAAAHFDRLTHAETSFGADLRRRYTELTSDAIGDERWLVHQLVSIYMEWFYVTWAFAVGGERLLTAWSSLTENSEGTLESAEPALSRRAALLREEAVSAMRRTMARAHMRYYGEQFFRDLTPAQGGPLCAIDIDGVLEMGWLSFPAISPDGALALRALIRHGQRPVLVTGRSLDEVRERCRAYRLAGGVAEYGAVCYNHLSGQSRVLLTPEQRADLEALRAALRRMDDVFVDDEYRYAVRAYRISEHGHRRGLTPEMIERALADLSGRERLRTIPGHEQTDFMAQLVDKGTGVRALVQELDATTSRDEEQPLLALAVGDSASDLPMFGLAQHAYAPANADEVVRARVREGASHARIMRRPFQAGLLEAVAHELGHHPRRCTVCRPPRMSREARLLLTAFGAQDRGKLGKFKQGVLLAGQLGVAVVRRRLAETGAR